MLKLFILTYIIIKAFIIFTFLNIIMLMKLNQIHLKFIFILSYFGSTFFSLCFIHMHHLTLFKLISIIIFFRNQHILKLLLILKVTVILILSLSFFNPPIIIVYITIALQVYF